MTGASTANSMSLRTARRAIAGTQTFIAKKTRTNQPKTGQTSVQCSSVASLSQKQVKFHRQLIEPYWTLLGQPNRARTNGLAKRVGFNWLPEHLWRGIGLNGPDVRFFLVTPLGGCIIILLPSPLSGRQSKSTTIQRRVAHEEDRCILS